MDKGLIFRYARHYLNTFGYCTIKSFAGKEICTQLSDEMKRYALSDKSYKGQMIDISLSAFAEVDLRIARYIFTNAFAEVANGLLNHPIIWGSDGCIAQTDFQFHRDLFINPTIYKFFIALSPGEFYVMPGTHIFQDSFARSAVKFFSGWDNANSTIFQSFSELHIMEERNSQFNELAISGATLALNKPCVQAISLEPGDLFVFSNNILHGLKAKDSLLRNTFFALNMTEGVSSFKKNKFKNKVAHKKRLLKNRIATLISEKIKTAIFEDMQSIYGLKLSEDVNQFLRTNSFWKETLFFDDISNEQWERIERKIEGYHDEYIRNDIPSYMDIGGFS